MRTNEWLSFSQNLPAWGKRHGAQTCAKADWFFLRAPRAPAVLPGTILPHCLGCEWSPNRSLPQKRETAGVGIVSWRLCRAGTGTLCQGRASTLRRTRHSGAHGADKALPEELTCAQVQTEVEQSLCWELLLLKPLWTGAACPNGTMTRRVLCREPNN